MKLIDLLVQELPKRGGWPEGVYLIEQNVRGCLFNADEPRLPFLFRGEFFAIAQDWRFGKVTRDQYESALAASQKPAWTGEGLPPVGCKCEWHDANIGWLPVTIKYISEQIVVMASSTNACGVRELTEIAKDIICDKPQFRPLHSEADKKRDAALDAIYGAIASAKREHNRSDEADEVYKAIAAGKIPGVKLDD